MEWRCGLCTRAMGARPLRGTGAGEGVMRWRRSAGGRLPLCASRSLTPVPSRSTPSAASRCAAAAAREGALARTARPANLTPQHNTPQHNTTPQPLNTTLAFTISSIRSVRRAKGESSTCEAVGAGQPPCGLRTPLHAPRGPPYLGRPFWAWRDCTAIGWLSALLHGCMACRSSGAV
jgi:hypothetical protein